MSVTKNKILKVLEKVVIGKQNIVAANAVRNIVIFDNEVLIDVVIDNPTLQAKKKLEDEIKKMISLEIEEPLVVKITFKVEKKIDNSAAIKGKKITGIDNIIAIASGKGGVGKSTVTANLAISLQKMGFSVGILDADIYGPSIPLLFDVAYEKPLTVTIDGKSKIEPVENYGIKILSIGFFAGVNQAVIWRGPMASKALNQLIFDAHWGDLDFLLVDLPPGTGDIHLSMVQALPIDGAVIVSTPQAIALADVKKGVAMFQQTSINVPVLGVLENMSYFTPKELPDNKYYIFGKQGAKNLAEDLKIPFIGEIPLVQDIREASDSGHPVALQDDTPLELSFKTITQNILTELLKRKKELPPTQVVKISTMSGCSTD